MSAIAAPWRTCDVLIVGGGSSGAIVARRLADTTRLNILLIEAGPSDEGDPTVLDISRLDDQRDTLDWGFKAAPLPGGPTELDYGRAKVLGGCGNHNDCAFLVPPPSDFRRWEALGATGWGPDDVAPDFARIEDRVTVTRSPSRTSVSEIFVAAGNELGLPTRDFRDGIADGAGYFPLNAIGAMRQSSSVAYLHPLDKLPTNLEVLTETMALAIRFESGRAVGVRTNQGEIKVSRELVLAAGSIQTPQLLMVSGIGPGAELLALGIPVVHDLPGVGQHLLDHVASSITFELTDPVPNWAITPYEATWLVSVEDGAEAPDILFHFGLRFREKYGFNPRLGNAANGVKLSPNVTRALSEGSVTLTSPDIRDAPRINLNYFSDPEGHDMRVLLKGTKFARRIMEADAFRAIAVCEVSPGPDIVTDADLEAYIRRVCETVYHPSGTCRMGAPGVPGTVVDPSLRLAGADNIRVVDASVFPAMVTVNINNTVMMVAERAARVIAADLRG